MPTAKRGPVPPWLPPSRAPPRGSPGTRAGPPAGARCSTSGGRSAGRRRPRPAPAPRRRRARGPERRRPRAGVTKGGWAPRGRAFAGRVLGAEPSARAAVLPSAQWHDGASCRLGRRRARRGRAPRGPASRRGLQLTPTGAAGRALLLSPARQRRALSTCIRKRSLPFPKPSSPRTARAREGRAQRSRLPVCDRAASGRSLGARSPRRRSRHSNLGFTHCSHALAISSPRLYALQGRAAGTAFLVILAPLYHARPPAFAHAFCTAAFERGLTTRLNRGARPARPETRRLARDRNARRPLMREPGLPRALHGCTRLVWVQALKDCVIANATQRTPRLRRLCWARQWLSAPGGTPHALIPVRAIFAEQGAPQDALVLALP